MVAAPAMEGGVDKIDAAPGTETGAGSTEASRVDAGPAVTAFIPESVLASGDMGPEEAEWTIAASGFFATGFCLAAFFAGGVVMAR